MFEIETNQSPLPYWFKPGWEPGVTILVRIPGYMDDEDFCDKEWGYNWAVESCVAKDANKLIESQRRDMFLGGWWGAINLPYESHPDGGLLVTKKFDLCHETTFSCDKDSKYDYETFLPPVPITEYEKRFYRESRDLYYKLIEDDGYFKYSNLEWPPATDYEEDDYSVCDDAYYEIMEEEIASYSMNPYTTDLN